MIPLLDKNEWEVLLCAKLRLKPGVTLHVEEKIRQGEVAPAGLAFDSATGKTYSLLPWHCHFMRMVESGYELEETVRVVVGLFPSAACRERIREFVVWMENKNLADVAWPNFRPPRILPRGNSFGGLSRPVLAPTGGPTKAVGSSRGEAVDVAHSRSGGKKQKGSHKNLYWGLGVAAAATVMTGFVAGILFRSLPRDVLVSGPERVTAKQVAPKLAGTIPIRAAAPGILTEVLVFDGDQIAKGDVVARIQDAEALKTLGELRRELGDHRVRRDDYYQAGNWEAYIDVVQTIVRLSQRIGEQEAASRPVDLRSPVSGEVEADITMGRTVGEEIGGGELIFKVRTGE